MTDTPEAPVLEPVEGVTSGGMMALYGSDLQRRNDMLTVFREGHASPRNPTPVTVVPKDSPYRVVRVEDYDAAWFETTLREIRTGYRPGDDAALANMLSIAVQERLRAALPEQAEP